MSLESLKQTIGGIDIYLLDEILKERYATASNVLDVGCGGGRNLKWFYDNDCNVYGIDSNEDVIENVKEKYKNQASHFSVQRIDAFNFQNEFFDYLICCAILHFAENEAHLITIFSELTRVLKPGGTIFIRMATIEGMEKYMVPMGDGVYHMPDGTDRFLLSQEILERLMQKFNLQFLDPIKYVNLDNKRSMATFVLKKLGT